MTTLHRALIADRSHPEQGSVTDYSHGTGATGIHKGQPPPPGQSMPRFRGLARAGSDRQPILLGIAAIAFLLASG
jgi:hypothetical protein